jgi:hypothetical protein
MLLIDLERPTSANVFTVVNSDRDGLDYENKITLFDKYFTDLEKDYREIKSILNEQIKDLDNIDIYYNPYNYKLPLHKFLNLEFLSNHPDLEDEDIDNLEDFMEDFKIEYREGSLQLVLEVDYRISVPIGKMDAECINEGDPFFKYEIITRQFINSLTGRPLFHEDFFVVRDKKRKIYKITFYFGYKETSKKYSDNLYKKLAERQLYNHTSYVLGRIEGKPLFFL